MTMLLIAQNSVPAFAGTYGIINGTVTDSATNVPIANIRVTATAATGTYTSVTDAHGFYSLAGITPDTLTVSFKGNGYANVSVDGVNVFADEQTRVDQRLTKSYKTIATVRANSAGGAFQPGSTADSYTVTKSQVSDVLGSDLNANEAQLIASLPGVSTTSGGTPVIRGGKANSTNYQVEGIPFSDAWSNQATTFNIVPDSLNELYYAPGVSGAQYGNAGTGTIDVLAHRGTYHQGATIEAGIGGPYSHSIDVGFGAASPDSTWSEYAAFYGSSSAPTYGGPNAPPAFEIYQQNAIQLRWDRHFTNNFIFKFGKNHHESIGLYTDIEAQASDYGYGGNWQSQCYASCDPVNQNNWTNSTGLTSQQYCQLTYLYPNQTGCNNSYIQQPETVSEPHKAYKLSYTNNLNSTTFLSASYYRDDALLDFDYTNPYFENIPIGGQNHGGQLDLTKQLSDKNLLQTGMSFNDAAPLLGSTDPDYGLWSLYYSYNTELYDFIPLSQCPSAAAFAGATLDCGYLSQYFTNGIPKIPQWHNSSDIRRGELDFYVNDTWTPNDHFKADIGLREESANLNHPAVWDPATCTFSYLPLTWNTSTMNLNQPIGGANCPTATWPDLNPVFHPHFTEPRIAIADKLGQNDVLRASFGRSIRLPRDNSYENSYGLDLNDPLFAPFESIPSHFFNYGTLPGGVPAYPSPWYASNPTGPYANAAMCGAYYYNHGQTSYAVPCVNYAEELGWDQNNGVLSPVVPETFTQYDASYEHRFTRGILHNVSFKITPWYRRGYNAESQLNLPLLSASGQPVTQNGLVKYSNVTIDSSVGQDYADGLELLVTKDNPHGIGGFFSATYTNSFSTAGDVYGGAISPTALQIGSPYSRVNYISPFYTTLAFSYRIGGWRINPSIHYNIGYPYGAGISTLTTLPNGTAVYVPTTNVSNSGEPIQYVDPVNPGSELNPNIAASTGTNEGKYPGGVLTHPYSTTQLTIEHDDNRGHVIGLEIHDIFNTTVWSGPTQNYSNPNASYGYVWQPVATGIGGPFGGVNPNSYAYPSTNFNNNPAYGAYLPYINYKNQTGRSWYVYFKLTRL